MKDIDILARTIYGEARGENIEGKKAVGHVILNRYRSNKWFAGATIADTCQKAWQFSCWNMNDPNRNKILQVTGAVLDPYLRLAEDLIIGKYKDSTHGATHYHTKNIKPAWTKGKKPCAIIGGHVFYNNVE